MSFTEVTDGRVVVRVDADIFPLDAFHQAAYVLLDRAYILLEGAEGGGYRAVLEPKDDDDPLDAVAGEFANELLNQAYRASVADERRVVLETIVGRAIAGASGPPPADDDAEPS